MAARKTNGEWVCFPSPLYCALCTDIRPGILCEGASFIFATMNMPNSSSKTVVWFRRSRQQVRHPATPSPLQWLLNSLDLSWEPTENFHDCERLLNSFWLDIGEHKKEKTREGIELVPRKQWIGTYLLRSCPACT